MQILDNFIILSLIIVSFISGIKVAERYHAREKIEIENAVRKALAQQTAGDLRVYPQRERMPIGQPFMDKLRSNGKATQKLEKDA